MPNIILRAPELEDIQSIYKWENDENVIHNRAASISVEIYKDLELWDTVVLDESNDWSYSWAYSSSPDWRVKEAEVPDGYTVIYRSNDTQFAIVL